jgi:hypothetical protein
VTSNVLAAAALIGVLIGIVQLRQLRKQRRRDFEDLFVQRYWILSDRLSLGALRGAPDASTAVITTDDEKAVIAYLRLCEDELELWQQGWISADTWDIWSAGIQQQLQRWPFEQVWEKVRAKEGSAGSSGEFQHLRACADEIGLWSPALRPKRVNAVRRFRKGR